MHFVLCAYLAENGATIDNTFRARRKVSLVNDILCTDTLSLALYVQDATPPFDQHLSARAMGEVHMWAEVRLGAKSVGNDEGPSVFGCKPQRHSHRSEGGYGPG